MRRILILALAIGCGGGTTKDQNSTTNNSTTTGQNNTVASNNMTTNDGEITLDTCSTTIAADVPEFFRRYFQCVDIALDGEDVVITTKDLPPHRSNYYGEGHPNYEPFDTSRGTQYHANPNTLGEQNIVVRIPVAPESKGLTIVADMVDMQMGTNPEEYGGGPRGVALDGVALFDDQAAVGDDINEEKYTFDRYNAHPAMTTYHYHTASPGPLEVLAKLGLTQSTTPTEADIEVYGIMCDGTVVLGCTELDGSAVTGELDAQNGHQHDLVDEQGTTLLTDRYHTHICDGVYAHAFTPEIQSYQLCGVTAPRM